jgi:uncharacterized membrane protein YkoI
MSTLRTKLVTAAAVGAAAVSGAAVAGAATSGTSASSGSSGSSDHGRHTVNGKSEQALTGDTASKVRAAALAKVPGTIDRVETNVDGSAPYEAHIVRKSDGAEVEVQVSKDFTVAAVNAMGDHGGNDNDGPGQP